MIQILIAILISVIFLGYSYYIYKRFGILKSVSASSYALKGFERWKFFAVLTTMGALNLFMGMSGWGFFASVGIIFAGVTIDHREPPAEIPHTVGTLASIVCTFIGFIVLYNVWLPAILAVISILGIVLSNIDNKVWWIEIICMVIATIGYIMIYI